MTPVNDPSDEEPEGASRWGDIGSLPNAARAVNSPADRHAKASDSDPMDDEVLVYEDRERRVEAICNLTVPPKEVMGMKLQVDCHDESEVKISSKSMVALGVRATKLYFPVLLS